MAKKPSAESAPDPELRPTEGGSYVRLPDGSLQRVAVEADEPVTEEPNPAGGN